MTTQKKPLNSAAIGAGALCVVLAIAVVGMYFLYNNAQSSYNSELQIYANYQSSYSHSNDDYNSVQSSLQQAQTEITQLQNSGSTSNAITSLQASTTWINDQTVSQANSEYSTWTFSASYAGYVVVNVQSSTVAGTHVEAIWSADGVSYNQEITVNQGSSATFPVLPSSIQIGVGNALLLGSGATETVTVTYYY